MKITKFDFWLNIWISLIINVVLSIVLPLAAMGMITWGIFLKGFAVAFPASTIIVLVIPITKLGNFIAIKLGLKPQSLPFTLVSTAILALILSTFMSLLMTAANAGFGPHFVGAWLSAYGWALISVYVSALIGVWTGLPLMIKLIGPPTLK